MKKTPELSISIVNTNNKELLKDCIESIIVNTKRVNYEIIVVDNASNDGSEQMVVDEYPKVKLIKIPKRNGYGYCHNKGILKAKGEYILIFNEDMIVLPNALDEMIKIIKKDKKIGALGCKLLSSDGTLQPSCSYFPDLKRHIFETFVPRNIMLENSKYRRFLYSWNHDTEREVEIIQGCCMLIPRSVFDQVGIFDTQFYIYSEENDLCKRIKMKGYKVYFTPKSKIIHIGGQTSKTMSLKMNLIMIDSKMKYFRKYHNAGETLLYKVITAMGAIIRFAGWSGKLLINTKEKNISKENMHRYLKSLTYLAGITKINY